MTILMVSLRILAFTGGIWLVVYTILSAIRTFVLPRADNAPMTRLVFRSVYAIFDIYLKRESNYYAKDRVLAFFAPIALLMMPITWMLYVAIGYTLVYWALGVPILEALALSGSSLLTLGFRSTEDILLTLLEFSEATFGLALIALLIAYLPTMYNAFSLREAAVNLLEVRAGVPPSAVVMIIRYFNITGFDAMSETWSEWERWFTQLEESHTSLAPLIWFRSSRPDLSWVTAAGAVLDGASLMASTVDTPRNPRAELCLRAGYLALRKISDFFSFPYDPNPAPTAPISILREEFDAACLELEAAGVPLKPDRDQCWRDFAGWRVNYDTVLRFLCGITQAPYAPWSSDRPLFR